MGHRRKLHKTMTRFRMFGIHLDQFAILADKTPANAMEMKVGVNFKYADEGRKIACSAKFDFVHEQKALMVLAVNCEFEIQEEDFRKLRADKKTIINKNLLEFFTVHTIGTARGILFCKTESTPFNSVIIPPINVSEIIKNDMVIE